VSFASVAGPIIVFSQLWLSSDTEDVAAARAQFEQARLASKGTNVMSCLPLLISHNTASNIPRVRGRVACFACSRMGV
jgi:hypothetical protein